jgi:hypothetical protein
MKVYSVVLLEILHIDGLIPPALHPSWALAWSFVLLAFAGSVNEASCFP